MKQIEKRTRFLRKLRRIVILLLIGVAMAILLIPSGKKTDENAKKPIIFANKNISNKNTANIITVSKEDDNGKSVKSVNVETSTNYEKEKSFVKKEPTRENVLTKEKIISKDKKNISFKIKTSKPKNKVLKNEEIIKNKETKTNSSKEKIVVENKSKKPQKKKINKPANKKVQVAYTKKDVVNKNSKSSKEKSNQKLDNFKAESTLENLNEHSKTKKHDEPKKVSENEILVTENEVLVTENEILVAENEVLNNKNNHIKTLNFSMYRVQQGDTLSEIAERRYGEGNSKYWKEIATCNNITNTKHLKVKSLIKIPNLFHVEEIRRKKRLPKSSNGFLWYEVKQGDTFGEIAAFLKMTREELKQDNNQLININNIRVGDFICYRKRR